MADKQKVRPFPALAILKPASLRTRLWQAGICLAVFIATLAVGNFVIAPEKALNGKLLGHDFMAFYTAGTFVREGRTSDLYNLDAVRTFQHQLARRQGLEVGKSFGPWWNPPFYAWAFAPLSMLPYPQALATWTIINVLSLVGAIALLCDMLPGLWVARPYNQGSGWVEQPRDWRSWALVPLLIICSMPFIQSISHGQNTCTSLLLLSLAVTCWRQKRAVMAGAVAGLLFYKPQLALVLSAVMTLSLGWRFLLGLSFTGGLIALFTGATMPGAIAQYAQQLPANLHFMQVENTYLWERHVTLKALLRLLLQGRGPGEALPLVTALTIAASGVFALALVAAVFRHWRRVDDPWTGETQSIARDRLIAATVACTPLLMPFYFDYDLLLLAVPAVLFSADMLRPGGTRTRQDRWLIATWMALYLWLVLNPNLAGRSGINGTTLLLSALSLQLCVRACRKRVSLELPDVRGIEVPRPSVARLAA